MVFESREEVRGARGVGILVVPDRPQAQEAEGGGDREEDIAGDVHRSSIVHVQRNLREGLRALAKRTLPFLTLPFHLSAASASMATMAPTVLLTLLLLGATISTTPPRLSDWMGDLLPVLSNQTLLDISIVTR